MCAQAEVQREVVLIAFARGPLDLARQGSATQADAHLGTDGIPVDAPAIPRQTNLEPVPAPQPVAIEPPAREKVEVSVVVEVGPGRLVKTGVRA